MEDGNDESAKDDATYLDPSISLDNTLIHSTIDLPFIDHDFISHLVSVKWKDMNKCTMVYLNVNSYR